MRNPIEFDQACKIKMDTIKILMNNTLKQQISIRKVESSVMY